MPLQVPGSSSSQLALSAPAAPSSGADKLEPQFHAILSQNKVEKQYLDLLGDSGCDSASVFGHIGGRGPGGEEKFAKYLKRC